ncbi:MAG: ectonucleotide pyrophosphatase/phosphodiesterase [Cyanobacteria bacterium]|nr:ectonucleotide pyrophosphatase/phosphodiesterase [Cyanobacteriota bacterium]
MTRRSLLAAAVAIAVMACGNAAPRPDRAILILISIDGFRWDYFDRFTPPALTALADDGVRADGLLPEFPSKTFPNHYTIVTGLRLAHHGIISNNMRATDIPGEFSLSNRKVQADPRWWGGEPIWNTAEKQGRKAAAMFWPGSETVINGRQATYWTPYDDDMPNRDRVNRILGWLTLPENERPSFLTLYFSDVDNAGHSSGPDSAEVKDAVLRVDAEVAALVSGVTAAGLADRVNYVIVSDHGMSAVGTDRVIVLDDYVNVDHLNIVDWSPVLALSPNDGDVEKLYAALKGKHPALDVYRSSEIPAEYRLAGHPRLPAIVGIAKEGWTITSKRNVERWHSHERRPPGGEHGFAATAPSMQGLFIANGPRIRRGLRVKPFENIHVYELMCAVLGLQPAKNDGDPAVTRDMLQPNR